METWLKDYREKVWSQQEQTLGALNMRIDAMMQRRTQAIMDRLDGLLGNRSWSGNKVQTQGDNRPRGPANIRGGSTGNRPTSDERPTRDANANGRCDSTTWSHANQGRSQLCDSNRREISEPLSEGNNAQAVHSCNATAIAIAFEPPNRSLEIFQKRLSRSSERSEKSRRVFKKPTC